MGYLKSVGAAVIYIVVFLAVITFIPGLPPEAEFSEYSVNPAAGLDGRADFKNRLNEVEVLYANELKGAEAFTSYNGELYSGISGGYIVKLTDNQIVPIVKFGQKCDGVWQENKCGRVLGLKFDNKGDLYAVDAYNGIFKVNVKTGQYKLLINSSIPIEGKVAKIPNSLDIAKNGDIYWTDSSSDFPLYDGVYSAIANPSGRLFYYNAATKKNKVLLKNLAFANGVMLSNDQSFLIVAETFASRIIKYHLTGPKAGQHEIFVESLPGVPDNIDDDGHGGFFISLYTYADSEHPLLFQSMTPHPYIRKMCARLLYILEAPFKLIQEIYPNTYAERLMHSIGSFESAKLLEAVKKSAVLRLNKNGDIIDAVYSNDDRIYGISTTFIHKGYVWLGSPHAEYIPRIPLKVAFPDLAMTQAPNKENQVHSQRKERDVTGTKSQTAGTSTKTSTISPAKHDDKAKTATPPPKTQKSTTGSTTTTTTARPTTEKPTTPKPNTPKTAESDKKVITDSKQVHAGSTKTKVEPTDKPVNKPTEKPVNKPIEKHVNKPAEKPVNKPAEKPVNKPMVKSTEKHVETPTVKPTVKHAQESTTKSTAKPTVEATASTDKPKATTNKAPKPTITPSPNVKPINHDVKKDTVKVSTDNQEKVKPNQVNSRNDAQNQPVVSGGKPVVKSEAENIRASSKPDEAAKLKTQNVQSEKLSTGDKNRPKEVPTRK
ncbi:hypothetical protein KM043_009757 [Ampulex compressa]|nr:hypothetical protein KM043_009757 [Ampulex compressa]